MAQIVEGKVVGEIIEIRFAYSGKVVWVKKHAGDTVTQGEAIASLDHKPLQTELDRQLAQYEKTRAEFEMFNSKFGADGGDDQTKFLRTGRQSELNQSVKDVELAKYKLDQADLICPIAGIITDDGGLVAGINITPASAGVRMLDTSSIRVKFSISQKDIEKFLSPKEVKVKVTGKDKEYKGTTVVPGMGKDGEFDVEVKLESTDGLLVGMKAKVQV